MRIERQEGIESHGGGAGARASFTDIFAPGIQDAEIQSIIGELSNDEINELRDATRTPIYRPDGYHRHPSVGLERSVEIENALIRQINREEPVTYAPRTARSDTANRIQVTGYVHPERGPHPERDRLRERIIDRVVARKSAAAETPPEHPVTSTAETADAPTGSTASATGSRADGTSQGSNAPLKKEVVRISLAEQRAEQSESGDIDFNNTNTQNSPQATADVVNTGGEPRIKDGSLKPLEINYTGMQLKPNEPTTVADNIAETQPAQNTSQTSADAASPSVETEPVRSVTPTAETPPAHNTSNISADTPTASVTNPSSVTRIASSGMNKVGVLTGTNMMINSFKEGDYVGAAVHGANVIVSGADIVAEGLQTAGKAAGTKIGGFTSRASGPLMVVGGTYEAGKVVYEDIKNLPKDSTLEQKGNEIAASVNKGIQHGATTVLTAGLIGNGAKTFMEGGQERLEQAGLDNLVANPHATAIAGLTSLDNITRSAKATMPGQLASAASALQEAKIDHLVSTHFTPLSGSPSHPDSYSQLSSVYTKAVNDRYAELAEERNLPQGNVEFMAKSEFAKLSPEEQTELTTKREGNINGEIKSPAPIQVLPDDLVQKHEATVREAEEYARNPEVLQETIGKMRDEATAQQEINDNSRSSIAKAKDWFTDDSKTADGLRGNLPKNQEETIHQRMDMADRELDSYKVAYTPEAVASAKETAATEEQRESYQYAQNIINGPEAKPERKDIPKPEIPEQPQMPMSMPPAGAAAEPSNITPPKPEGSSPTPAEVPAPIKPVEIPPQNNKPGEVKNHTPGLIILPSSAPNGTGEESSGTSNPVKKLPIDYGYIPESAKQAADKLRGGIEQISPVKEDGVELNKASAGNIAYNTEEKNKSAEPELA